MKALLFASLLTLAVLPMCKPDASKNTTTAPGESPASPAAVQAQLSILRDSADARWQRMTASDDKTLDNLRGLLQDLSKYPGANQPQLAELRGARARLQKERYTRETMASSALIDRYDTAQDSLLKAVYAIATPGGEARSEGVRDRVEAVQAADANVVLYRSHYDKAAKAYNAYLQVHGEELTSMGGQYAKLRPLPLFEISQ